MSVPEACGESLVQKDLSRDAALNEAPVCLDSLYCLKMVDVTNAFTKAAFETMISRFGIKLCIALLTSEDSCMCSEFK